MLNDLESLKEDGLDKENGASEPKVRCFNYMAICFYFLKHSFEKYNFHLK